jgi:hypothetical protein
MKKHISLHDKALMAMREAVRDVIEQHRKSKRPLAVWDYKNNKVKHISPAAALREFNKGLKKDRAQSQSR